MADGRAASGRLGLLLDQFDMAGEAARLRLAGLGDEEFRWEPVPGCWSLRRRSEATTSRAYGPGEWVLDKARPTFPTASTPGWPRTSPGACPSRRSPGTGT